MKNLLRKIRDAVLGDPEKIRAFREADEALQDDYDRRKRIAKTLLPTDPSPFQEDETYLRLNGRVNELWNTIPPWRR